MGGTRLAGCSGVRGGAYSSQIARAIAARGARRSSLDPAARGRIKSAVPVPAQFAGGHPARPTFQALRIAVNDELAQLSTRCPTRGIPGARRTAGRDLVYSLEDRMSSASSAARARGCVCPPDLPICVCGHEPEAELLNRRPWLRRRAKSPPTHDQGPRTCAPPASWRSRPHDAISAHPAGRGTKSKPTARSNGHRGGAREQTHRAAPPAGRLPHGASPDPSAASPGRSRHRRGGGLAAPPGRLRARHFTPARWRRSRRLITGCSTGLSAGAYLIPILGVLLRASSRCRSRC